MKHNSRNTLFVAIFPIAVMLLILIVVLGNSYQNKKLSFRAKMCEQLEKSVLQLYYKSLREGEYGKYYVSSSDTVINIFRDNILYRVKFKSRTDRQEIYESAMYDVRDTKKWNLIRLDSIFENKIDYVSLPRLFVLKDSMGRQLDILEHGIKKISVEKKGYIIRLGVLDKHTLTAYFDFPLWYFFLLEWNIVLTILVLFLALGICVCVFIVIINNERRVLSNQELFVQALNHDLKSRLGLACLYLNKMGGMINPIDDSEAMKFYEAAQRNASEMLKYVDQLLVDSVNEKGFVIKKLRFRLPNLIDELIKMMKTEIPDDKTVNFYTDYNLGGDDFIVADAFHLYRAIGNLLNNSIKYSNQEVSIFVVCIRKEREIIISVKDNGLGINKSDQKYMFDPGYRARSTEQKIKGFGLGLSYVKMVVKAHGGKIFYKENKPSGGTFLLSIKLTDT